MNPLLRQILDKYEHTFFSGRKIALLKGLNCGVYEMDTCGDVRFLEFEPNARSVLITNLEEAETKIRKAALRQTHEEMY